MSGERRRRPAARRADAARCRSVLADRFARRPALDRPSRRSSRASGPATGSAVEILAEFVRDLGATIVTAIHAYNPTVVVLAGGPMSAADLFLADVQAYVDEYAFIFPKGRIVELRGAQLEDHAGVLGAAAVVIERARGDPQ